MPFPTFTNLKSLDYAFAGIPFCNVGVTDSIDFKGLDTVFHGVPFSGTTTEGAVVVVAPAGIVTVSGTMSGIVSASIPRAPGQVDLAAAIAELATTILIVSPAGVAEVSGTIACGMISVPATPGLISSEALCLDVSLSGGILPSLSIITCGGGIGGVCIIVPQPVAQIAIDGLIVQTANLVPPVVAVPGSVVAGGQVQEIGFVVAGGVAGIFVTSSATYELSVAKTPAECSVYALASTRMWKAEMPTITYRCVLTGSADGLSDIEIPISSFQIRKRAL